jgi:hypothetical protein
LVVGVVLAGTEPHLEVSVRIVEELEIDTLRERGSGTWVVYTVVAADTYSDSEARLHRDGQYYAPVTPFL